MGRSTSLVLVAAESLLLLLLLLQGQGSSCHAFLFGLDDANALHVGGKVLCQDCSKGWNDWAFAAKPLNGCRVAVTCMDARRRVVYHGSDETDEQGAFEVVVDRHVVDGKPPLRPEDCSVRLVSSPHPNCNVLTDFSGGKSGVLLGMPSAVYRDVVKYTMGPFYFTSPMCDEPDTADFNWNGW